jgi:signal transduction histidine kinase
MYRLRTRLFLAFVIVVLVAVGTISVFVTRQADAEFERYEVASERLQTTRMAQWLTGYHVRNDSWEGVRPFVEEMDALTGMAVVLVDLTGSIIADSRGVASLGFVPTSWSEYPLVIDMDGIPGEIGVLYVSPERTIQEQFRYRLQNTLWILLLAGSGLGLLAALVVSTVVAGMISAPIQMMVRAATRAGEGDFTARVNVRRRDEVGELAEAFNGMIRELDAGLRLRRNQIADTAHELRNPLTNIRGYLEALDDNVMDLSETFPVIVDEVDLLMHLVEDLQELALAESGILELDRRPENMEELVQHTVTAMRLRAKEREIAVSVNAPREVPSVYVDSRRIGQVLSNILRNALRYTPRGGTITVSVKGTEDFVSVSVCDSGPGIPSEELDRVFQRFRRLDPSRSRATGGSGLGLTIARFLVELHGGEIVAGNRPEGGSCFTFTVPVAPSELTGGGFSSLLAE